MSTHAEPESRHASPAETTDGPDIEADDEPDPIAPFDAHNAAATFGADTRRLPNTVDSENKYHG